MIFVDSSFWIAFAIEADRDHAVAVALFNAHADSLLATSNEVCGETWTFTRRRFGHRTAVALIDRLKQTPRLRVLRAVETAEQEAWDWLRRRDEREYSYVDATSFALMRRLAMHEAFAFDGDFTAAGFVELRI
jgi:predicted nucleic acid-binding protein